MQCKNCGQDNPSEARFCGNCAAPLVIPIETPSPAAVLVPAPAPPALIAEHIGFWPRLGAAAVDWLVVSAILAVVRFMGWPFMGSPLLLLPWLYFSLFTGLNKGQTLGKMLVGVKVVKTHGEAPGLGYAVLREVVGKTISTLVLFLGFLWIAWDKEKQGWHDKMASTYVVKTTPRS